MKEYDTSLVEAAWDQPQGIMDLIGISFRLWKRNVGFIIKAYLWPTIILMIGSIGLQCAFTYAQSFMSDVTRIATISAIGIVSLVLYFAGFISVSLRSLAFIRVSNGFASDFDSAMAFCKKRLWWLVGSTILTSIMSAVGGGIWAGLIAGCVFWAAQDRRVW
jgi:hypothetical protein